MRPQCEALPFHSSVADNKSCNKLVASSSDDSSKFVWGSGRWVGLWFQCTALVLLMLRLVEWWFCLNRESGLLLTMCTTAWAASACTMFSNPISHSIIHSRSAGMPGNSGLANVTNQGLKTINTNLSIKTTDLPDSLRALQATNFSSLIFRPSSASRRTDIPTASSHE